MARVITSPEEFTIIGENIHATRVVLRKGRRVVTLDDGREAMPFKGDSGEQRHLLVPESYKSTQPYERGQIKHFMIAIMKGIGVDPDEQEEGAAYVRAEVRRQISAGARFLDLNVDEVSPDLSVQRRAMKWLVSVVQEVSSVPVSVDSSSAEIIAEGLAAYDGRAGHPMINSLALERLETLDLVKEYETRVIVSAGGEAGMPQDDKERVENVTTLMESVQSRGVPPDDVYVDPLVFPISVDSRNGSHFLNAVSEIRKAFGNDIHVTGGLSNVSFGLPKRKLVNDTFIHLGLEAGIDSGIIDPVQSEIGSVFGLDIESEPVRLATDMLMGNDDFCVNYIQAFRDGRLD